MKARILVLILLFLNNFSFASCNDIFLSWFQTPNVRIVVPQFSFSNCRVSFPTVYFQIPRVAMASCGGGMCSGYGFNQCSSCCCTDPGCGTNPCLSCWECCKNFGNVGADRGPCSYAGGDWDP